MGRRFGRFLALFIALTALAWNAHAHVGSPDVFFEGNAGPYPLYVTVRVPPVIPGVAQIEVRSESPGVHQVSIVPLRLTGPGSNLPPVADIAQPSKTDPQFFTGSLWLMEFGALQVRVSVDGDRGKGEVAVPVNSYPQRTLAMQRGLGIGLFALMIFLVVGAVSIAGAAVGEAKLDPGAQIVAPQRRHVRVVMIGTAIFAIVVVYLANLWWKADAAYHDRSVRTFQPQPIEATLTPDGVLDLKLPEFGRIRGRGARSMSREIIPDHGHLMHLFLIREPQMDRMFHLHPDRGADNFSLHLPDMPAGRYHIFADVVDASGFPWTFVGDIDVPETKGAPMTGDDSEGTTSAIASSPAPDADGSNVFVLADGNRMVWERDNSPLLAGQPASFHFHLEDSTGKTLSIEPYMGMAGHAEFVRSDFSVFAHVHPAGSVSMAAFDMAQANLTGSANSADTMAMTMPMSSTTAAMTMSMPTPAANEKLPPEVSFPYGFPSAGTYRIFVQIKQGGRVETGVFDATVR